MPRIRVLIVDDAVVIRRMLSSVIEKDPQLEVVGVAANGRIALQKILQCNPDLITLDVEMPEMDGITTLREIRKTHPHLPVIMVSTLTERGAVTTMEALSAGATDYVTKPANVGKIMEGLELMEQQLLPKIRAICAHQLPAAEPEYRPTKSQAVQSPPALRPAAATSRTSIECVTIGTSTGGPNALHDVFSNLPVALPVPIFVVQHMPPVFTAMLAERLGKCGPTVFHEGADGMEALPGHAYLAPGGKHMIVKREGTRVVVRLNEEPAENSCRPAVDPLFRSLAKVYGRNLLAVVMTGMGQDGLRGCQVLSEKGASIFVQDEASSVVWGMPGCIAHAGIADALVPLKDIAREIDRRTSNARRFAA